MPRPGYSVLSGVMMRRVREEGSTVRAAKSRTAAGVSALSAAGYVAVVDFQYRKPEGIVINPLSIVAQGRFAHLA